MLKKLAPFILLLLLAIILLLLRTCQSSNDNGKNTNNDKPEKREPNRSRGFDRHISYIEYTKHARCRMQCRHINEAEVRDIMANGKINYHKSNVQESPCPTYALEGYTQDQQHLRIVFAQCDNVTKVVTCIDLDHEFECECN